jgi:hypothetical protein
MTSTMDPDEPPPDGVITDPEPDNPLPPVEWTDRHFPYGEDDIETDTEVDPVDVDVEGVSDQ